MTRLPDLSDDALSPEQRRIRDEIASGPRGGARGPFPAMLRSPELAKRAAHLGEFLRFNTSLPPRLSELAILVTARAWTAQYEWYAHAKLALKGGLAPAVVDAIAERREPPFEKEDERIVYTFCHELHATHGVSDATYEKTVAAFGERGVVELIGLSGYYVMVGMTLNVAQVQLPEGEPLPLKP
ncbi:MAG: carboxymuconolactone decarboxylase family protein [Alphaproteobacteria bacterium]